MAAGSFTLATYHRLNQSNFVRVYIEGDGKAWENKYTLSLDPTPAHPVALELAIRDSADSVVLRRGRTDRTHPAGAQSRKRRDGRLWRGVDRKTRLAYVVALGYADGLLRAASGTDRKPGGAAMIAARRCPIVGHISMDLACIDVTELPDAAVHRQPTLRHSLASRSVSTILPHRPGTIGYEILTRLGPSLSSRLSWCVRREARRNKVHDGCARTQLRLPELRRGGGTLGRPL